MDEVVSDKDAPVPASVFTENGWGHVGIAVGDEHVAYWTPNEVHRLRRALKRALKEIGEW